MDDATSISNIISLFARHLDERDFASVGALFSEIEYRASLGGSGYDGGDPATAVRGAGSVAAHYERVVTEINASWLESLGVPGDPARVRTRHLFDNLVMEIDEGSETARASYYGTVQAWADGVPLTTRYMGRYFDSFERRDGVWRIVRRHQAHDYQGYAHQGLPVARG